MSALKPGDVVLVERRVSFEGTEGSVWVDNGTPQVMRYEASTIAPGTLAELRALRAVAEAARATVDEAQRVTHDNDWRVRDRTMHALGDTITALDAARGTGGNNTAAAEKERDHA